LQALIPVTPTDRQTFLQRTLAFKAYEIEELADVWFFRPAGAVLAYAARALRLTPSEVTVCGGVVGVLAGSLLYDERYGLVGFALLIMHGVLDSADGQLARLTGQTSELGKVLDGVAGYATHAAIYIAIVAGHVSRGGSPWFTLWAVAAIASNVLHAQMYDYHRITYASIVVHGEVPHEEVRRVPARWARAVLAVYRRAQRRMIGRHADVESAIAARATGGRVAEADRARYRASFYRLVRGWNVFGDNTRFYAIGLLAWWHALDWFPVFVAVPMNVVLAALWLWQWRADRRFLAV